MNDQAGFDALLDYLARTRAFDFTGYKPGSVARRITKRMHEVGVEGYSEYIDYLEVHPDEFEALFNTILINVTGFFRDREPWDRLESEAVPRILEAKGSDDPIRVWSAGCAAGQEAYSVAMVLAEALGLEEYTSRVKIYATDVDEEALTQARHGSYDEKEVADVPEVLRERYFTTENGRCVFRKNLRGSVIFGRNDLVQDAPISRIDLLLCRNTLMYFHAETQERILGRFHFALNPSGIMFLGKSEMLTRHGDLFSPLDHEHRLFVKIGAGRPRERDEVREPGPDSSAAMGELVRDAAADIVPVAQVLIDAGDHVIAINQEARTLFGVGVKDIGRPLHDLRLSYRPVELRAAIEEVKRHPQSIELGEVEWTTPTEEARRLVVRLAPLIADGNLEGISIVFVDVSRFADLERELASLKSQTETALEELQTTSEELETTNEELQSTNEELETTNEELQSTNEELATVNEQLRERTLEAVSVNTFLEGILATLPSGVIVVDRDLTVQLWNRQSEEMWGLRADEVSGQPLLELDIGLPLDDLEATVRGCLSDGAVTAPVDLSAVNRRGRAVDLRVTCRPLESSKGVGGVIVLLDTKPADVD
ncbi:MAG TPA: CheR family methyltransferase [Solirubrobacteraceae bacterium]|nr:CheR family methyltransferase [Solirubrobacteraceae bacterium]